MDPFDFKASFDFLLFDLKDFTGDLYIEYCYVPHTRWDDLVGPFAYYDDLAFSQIGFSKPREKYEKIVENGVQKVIEKLDEKRTDYYLMLPFFIQEIEALIQRYKGLVDAPELEEEAFNEKIKGVHFHFSGYGGEDYYIEPGVPFQKTTRKEDDIKYVLSTMRPVFAAFIKEFTRLLLSVKHLGNVMNSSIENSRKQSPRKIDLMKMLQLGEYDKIFEELGKDVRFKGKNFFLQTSAMFHKLEKDKGLSLISYEEYTKGIAQTTQNVILLLNEVE